MFAKEAAQVGRHHRPHVILHQSYTLVISASLIGLEPLRGIPFFMRLWTRCRGAGAGSLNPGTVSMHARCVTSGMLVGIEDLFITLCPCTHFDEGLSLSWKSVSCHTPAARPHCWQTHITSLHTCQTRNRLCRCACRGTSSRFPFQFCVRRDDTHVHKSHQHCQI